MNQKIESLLDEIESDHGIEILYACESGSRAWGFASPDSDYDIRFLFRPKSPEVPCLKGSRESIELPINDLLDPAGWSLRKALRLLHTTNGALLEWLHSPIIYRTNPIFHEELKQFASQNFSTRALAYHYYGLARSIHRTRLTQGTPPSAKSILYALRAVLAADWILLKVTPPPVEFDKLLPLAPDQLHDELDQLLCWKSDSNEGDEAPPFPKILEFIETSLDRLSGQIEALQEGRQALAPFDEFLQKWSRKSEQFFTRNLMKKADFTLERVREQDLLLFESVSGSRSFGTEHENSDFDLRGVFIAPPSMLGGLEKIEQVSDEKNDEVYYELGRFVSLLEANNPNLVELLFTPKSCLRFKHPVFDLLDPEIFLSKRCLATFGNYAMGQIRKARGLNKKIVNPEPEARRQLRDFCHVLVGQGSKLLSDWLTKQNLHEGNCGLVAAPHATNTYALFHDPDANYRGIFSRKDDSAVLCSPVAKDVQPIAWISCNLDAFKAHCRSHREYWEWVELRNEERYETNRSHGRGYDSKNLMHTLRLLDEAIEIATEKRIVLPRPNADWLKKVKAGDYQYEELLKLAEEKLQEAESAFRISDLPEKPDHARIHALLLEIRDKFRAN